MATATAAIKDGFIWMMSNDITGEKWKMLPTKLSHPSTLPQELRCYGTAWEITGEPQSPLKSAVFQGVNLTLKHLELIRDILKFRLPDKGKGSGKNGNIIKVDWATALVNHLWPDESDDSKKRMVDAICGRRISQVKCTSDILAAVKELGAEGERDFAYIHQVALNQEAVEKERKQRTDTAEREDQKTFTPGSLKSLLPNAAGVMCSRNPILSRYQGFYPGHSNGSIVFFSDFSLNRRLLLA